MPPQNDTPMSTPRSPSPSSTPTSSPIHPRIAEPKELEEPEEPDDPEVPRPEASFEEVQGYLVQYSRSMCDFTQEEALAWAQRLQVNGKRLYQVDKEELTALYGIPGRLLFSHLQNSNTVAYVLTLPYDMLRITNEHISVPESMALWSVGWNHCDCHRDNRCGSKLLERLHYHSVGLRRSSYIVRYNTLVRLQILLPQSSWAK